MSISLIYIILLLLLFLSVTIYALAGLGLLKPLAPLLSFGFENQPGIPENGPKKQRYTFLYIALLTIFSRLVLSIIAYWAIIMERGPQNGGFWHVIYNTFIGPGDTPHYLKIAQHWYASSGDDAKYIVFYPLYPICVAIVNFLTQGGLKLINVAAPTYFISGMIVSNVCLIVACYYLYRLVFMDYEEGKAKQAVLFLLLYPFSVFLIGIFTESMFIMLSVMIFYYMRKQNWWACGILGLLASMSRTQGILLIIPVLYEYALVNEWFKGLGIHKISGFFKKLKPDLLYILLMPLGFVIYLAVNKIMQGDWFAYYKHITAPPWWQGSDWIGKNLYQHYDMSQQYYSLGLIIYKVQIAAFFICCGLVVYGLWKRIRTSYVTYMLAYLMFTFSSSWMISGPRYVMGDIPIYVVLAVAAQKRNTQIAFLVLLGLLCVLYTILFFQGQAIM